MFSFGNLLSFSRCIVVVRQATEGLVLACLIYYKPSFGSHSAYFTASALVSLRAADGRWDHLKFKQGTIMDDNAADGYFHEVKWQNIVRIIGNERNSVKEKIHAQVTNSILPKKVGKYLDVRKLTVCVFTNYAIAICRYMYGLCLCLTVT